jgi:hypothetical protein
LALPPSGTTDQAFVREVDEEYRREQVQQLFRRYGRWILGGIVVLLLALALFLYVQHRRDRAAGQHGEQYDEALRAVEQGPAAKAQPALAAVAASGDNGFAAMAQIASGNLLLQQKDAKGAAARFAAVAGNTAYAKPYRDLALIRQTVAEFDLVKPGVVIERMKPLAAPDSPWLGAAGELLASAYLKAGNRAEAGRLYGRIAQGGAKVPETARQRATQLAGVLGVDAIDQSKDSKVQ